MVLAALIAKLTARCALGLATLINWVIGYEWDIVVCIGSEIQNASKVNGPVEM